MFFTSLLITTPSRRRRLYYSVFSSAPGGASAFFPFIIPYVMRSQSNARCMRSRVTISRIVFHQMRGPANTTGQGSYTPTQIMCLKLLIVY